MAEREQSAGRQAGDDREEAVDVASPAAAADDEAYRRQMALGRSVQTDFDEALAELAGAPRQSALRPNRGLMVEETI